MPNYYDGTKLLSLMDINGKLPEIYICTTNRSGGKTTYFNRYVVKKFLEGKGKFGILYRFSKELPGCEEKFFKDVGELFFPEYGMRSESRGDGDYYELYLYKKTEVNTKKPGRSCGYALALNGADQIKKQSHQLNDINRMIFDEFQSETNHYCSNEIDKFISIHASIARGHGEQSRYVPVYMLANHVTLLNPYYIEFDISNRLQADTKFLRGDGFVLEHGWIESAAEAQKKSAFNRAFARNHTVAYLQEKTYLNDNVAFVEKIGGASRYIATLVYKDVMYGIRAFDEKGIIYCDNRPDTSYPLKLSITTDDHNINYVMLKANNDFILRLRYYFDHGCFRFRDLRCKEVILKALSY